MNRDPHQLPKQPPRLSSRSRALAASVSAVLAIQLVACATPSASHTTSLTDSTDAPESVHVQPTAPSHDPHLAARLGPGDVFEVRVFQEPELSGTHRVGPEGGIDFPFCGRLEIQGRTAGEVASLVSHCLRDGRFLREPQVTVVPTEFHSKKVFVFGHVAKPGTFVFENGMSIVQAITLAGGFVEFAARNSVNVTRKRPDGSELRYQVPVTDVGTGKSPNFLLEPGDIVYVPRGIL